MKKHLSSKNLIILIVFAFVMMLICFCCILFMSIGLSSLEVKGSSEVTTEEFDLGNINSLEVNIDAEIKVEKGSENSLEIEAEDNIIENIEFTQKGGKLKIQSMNDFPYLFGRNLGNTKPIVINIVLEQLDDIEVDSNANVDISNFSSEDFDLDLNGSGEITILSLNSSKLETNLNGSGKITLTNVDIRKELKLKLPGSGSVQLSGQADFADIEIAGSGDVNAENLITQEMDIDISGSGEARVYAIEKLDVKITGSGDVGYIGSPDIKQDSTGSGKLFKID